MNTVYVVERGLKSGGRSQGGISTALVAKHKRKDQLIDKILIKGFDFSDRSVKATAAPLCTSVLPPTTTTVSISAFQLNFLMQELKLKLKLFFKAQVRKLQDAPILVFQIPIPIPSPGLCLLASTRCH